MALRLNTAQKSCRIAIRHERLTGLSLAKLGCHAYPA